MRQIGQQINIKHGNLSLLFHFLQKYCTFLIKPLTFHLIQKLNAINDDICRRLASYFRLNNKTLLESCRVVGVVCRGELSLTCRVGREGRGGGGARWGWNAGENYL